VTGFAYEYNPRCICAWCANGGVNPTPGAPASLGFDVAHMPPASMVFAPRLEQRPPLKLAA
jgi:hypothetical protein